MSPADFANIAEQHSHTQRYLRAKKQTPSATKNKKALQLSKAI
jgi:hypothetical protein